LGWLRTVILLIAASCVARITGVSHQGPAAYVFLAVDIRLSLPHTIATKDKTLVWHNKYHVLNLASLEKLRIG
jgi:hypothetical protein